VIHTWAVISEPVADQFIADLQNTRLRGAGLRRKGMEMLSELPAYNWSGIYRLDGQALVLDEFVGAPTDHTEISVGVGVCGTAVAENRNQVIEDVRELSNYLACSLQTRSEIVVLIRRGDEVLGQIDVDGHEVGAFDHSDEAFLERVAKVLAERWQ
jgi:L-methionine (R)-S-oxide reductase